MKKKGAIEFSVNFIIGLIVGILMFSLGLIFLFNILKSTEIKPGILPSNFDRLAQNCIDNQIRLCLPESYKEGYIGKTYTFGLVIYNTMGEEKKFKPYVNFAVAELKDGDILNSLNKKWTFDSFREITLKDNEHYILKIPFKIPSGTKKGTYVFNVNVCFDSDVNRDQNKCPDNAYPSLYDSTEQIRIEVK
ncbi:MAG: hypothetical protein QW757_03530 [Candidatus Woesearchaeota archaeon]